jgi:hypothetical protein
VQGFVMISTVRKVAPSSFLGGHQLREMARVPIVAMEPYPKDKA